jgi:3-oxoacyl-[acyl-carrier protein] reductase
VRHHLLGLITLQRFGEAAEVAHAAVVLASDAASYITGQTLNVNGGIYMG